MSVEITVPAMGESITEATIGQWLKREGEGVSAGDPVVELETDKVNMEVPSPGNGQLASILKNPGDTVSIGDVLAVLEEGSADGKGAAQPERDQEFPRTPASGKGGSQGDAVPSSSPGDASPADDGTRATPIARRMAADHGIELSAVTGTGPSGRIRREDVEAHLATQRSSQSTQASPDSTARAIPIVGGPEREERVRMSRLRQTIANRLVEAQHTAAMLTTFNEVDMSTIMSIRKKRREEFKERHGVGLGFMSFFTKAVVAALQDFPRLNAEIQGDEMVLKRYYDIGIAVSTDDGLVVPVLRDADTLSFAEIEQQVVDLATRARSRQLTLPELQGGTFTITNGGVFGSLLSTPILNTPQVGILGMHKIEERPVVVDGQVVVRPMMYLAVSYDHRIVDGAEAVSFLVRVKELLEDPVNILLEH